MITVVKHPVFIVSAVLFWINQYLEKVMGIFIPIYHAYGDDLMAMPVAFGICLQVMRWLHPLKNQLVFTKRQLLIGLGYFSLVFEGILPLYAEKYVADPLDVVCYAIGSYVFYLFMNKPELEGQTENCDL